MNAVVTFISLIYGFIFKTTQCFYAIEIVFFSEITVSLSLFSRLHAFVQIEKCFTCFHGFTQHRDQAWKSKELTLCVSVCCNI